MKAYNWREKIRLFIERQKQKLYGTSDEETLQSALAMTEKIFGKEHSKTANALNQLGIFYKNKNEFDKAKDYLQRVLAIFEKILGEEHLDTATTLHNLGLVYANKNDTDKAEDYLQRALTIVEKKLGKEHPKTAGVLNGLGNVYYNKKEFDKADKYLQRAKDITEKSSLIKDSDAEIINRNHQILQQEITRLEREKLEIQAALYQSKKLEYLGQMTTLMAHNMNQPIGVLRNATSGALGDINENLFNPDAELKPLLEKILNQTERLSLIMGNFRNFARGDRTVLSAVNLHSVIEDIYQLLFVAQYQLDKIELKKDLNKSHIAYSNEFALQEMLISLLSNAREAVKDKAIKKAHLKTWRLNNKVGFCVEDSGDGISEENMEKLFTPFLSSKNEGMGLGLYFCREIAKNLGGSIEYYRSALGGAGFKITLPNTKG